MCTYQMTARTARTGEYLWTKQYQTGSGRLYTLGVYSGGSRGDTFAEFMEAVRLALIEGHQVELTTLPCDAQVDQMMITFHPCQPVDPEPEEEE